jgi:hypothetical protein
MCSNSVSRSNTLNADPAITIFPTPIGNNGTGTFSKKLKLDPYSFYSFGQCAAFYVGYFTHLREFGEHAVTGTRHSS